MKRMNFPHRKLQRRKEASERQVNVKYENTKQYRKKWLIDDEIVTLKEKEKL